MLEELQRAAATGQDAGLTQAKAQLQGLARLAQKIGGADAGELRMVRAEVAASLAATQALMQQAPGFAASGHARETALHVAAHAVQHEVEGFLSDYYEQRKFEPFLQFASAEEEAAFRRREAEREKAIREALREGTPEADLRAADLTIAQLKDAGAHGADRSPEYQTTLDTVTGVRDNLAGQLAGADRARAERDALSAASRHDPIPLPADLLASISSARIAVANADQPGHGLTARELPAVSGPGRG